MTNQTLSLVLYFSSDWDQKSHKYSNEIDNFFKNVFEKYNSLLNLYSGYKKLSKWIKI